MVWNCDWCALSNWSVRVPHFPLFSVFKGSLKEQKRSTLPRRQTFYRSLASFLNNLSRVPSNELRKFLNELSSFPGHFKLNHNFLHVINLLCFLLFILGFLLKKASFSSLFHHGSIRDGLNWKKEQIKCDDFLETRIPLHKATNVK